MNQTQINKDQENSVSRMEELASNFESKKTFADKIVEEYWQVVAIVVGLTVAGYWLVNTYQAKQLQEKAKFSKLFSNSQEFLDKAIESGEKGEAEQRDKHLRTFEENLKNLTANPKSSVYKEAAPLLKAYERVADRKAPEAISILTTYILNANSEKADAKFVKEMARFFRAKLNIELDAQKAKEEFADLARTGTFSSVEAVNTLFYLEENRDELKKIISDAKQNNPSAINLFDQKAKEFGL